MARITELNLELSLLKLDDLNDPTAALKEVEAALQASPDNPAALGALARLHLKANDFAAYSSARVREAKALAGRPEAVEALLDAGRVYREQLNDPAKARDAFEAALREAPDSAEALHALASVLSAEANWDEARRVLTRQLEITSDSNARAAVLSDLARVAWEGFNDAPEAQRLLDEALALVPDHLPAILEIADIYYKEGQWEQAEKRLTEAVRRLRNQPQQAAKLFQRLAEVHEKTGKLDEAYRQLLEADKMGPGQLLTKLSLGENRFRAGKWREAAMHLGALADHPDAATYPDEVADALAHAAQAEIKLRRPERAIELYEAAIGLRGGHRASLRALADLALERGEREKASSYLRRLADESSDRAERAQTLEQLGDLYVELDDEAQALKAYLDAHKASVAPSEEQVALLEKTLKLQRVERRLGGGGRDLGAAHRSGQGSQGARRTAARRRAHPGRARRGERGGGAARQGARGESARRGGALRAVRPRRSALAQLRPRREAGPRARRAAGAGRSAGRPHAPGASLAAAGRAPAGTRSEGGHGRLRTGGGADPRPAPGPRGAGGALRRRSRARSGGHREPQEAPRRRHHALGLAARARRHLRAARPG